MTLPARRGWAGMKSRLGEAVSSEDFFLDFAGIDRTRILEGEVLKLLGLFWCKKSEIFEGGNHACSILEVATAHRALSPFTPNHYIESFLTWKDDHLYLHSA